MKKYYTYSYNTKEKEWEKISLENELFHPKDILKKERIQIIKDTLEFIKMYSGKDRKNHSVEYLPIILLPSKLFIVIGNGLSTSLLNGLNQQEMKQWKNSAIFIKIDNKVAFGYTNTKDQVKRWGLYRRDILGGEFLNKEKKLKRPKEYSYILEVYKDEAKKPSTTKVDYETKDDNGNLWLDGAIGNIMIRAKYNQIVKTIYLITMKEYKTLFSYIRNKGIRIIENRKATIEKLDKMNCPKYDCENKSVEEIEKINRSIRKELRIK